MQESFYCVLMAGLNRNANVEQVIFVSFSIEQVFLFKGRKHGFGSVAGLVGGGSRISSRFRTLALPRFQPGGGNGRDLGDVVRNRSRVGNRRLPQFRHVVVVRLFCETVFRIIRVCLPVEQLFIYIITLSTIYWYITDICESST